MSRRSLDVEKQAILSSDYKSNSGGEKRGRTWDAPHFALWLQENRFRVVPRKMSRVALGVTSQGSHRSGRAQLTHPARLVAVSRALCYPWSFRGQWIGVQCPRTVARARFRDKAPPSLHRLLAARVPRLLWSYGVLRFPYALPAALRFLRATVTIPCACVRLSIQVRRRLGARGFRVWQPLDSQSLKRWRRTGVPSSWGTLVCLCPVL